MKKPIGLFIVATLVFFLLSVFTLIPLTVATLLAWIVPILTWRTLGKAALQQALWLLLIGVATLFFAASQGVFLGWQQIFATNIPLLAMFVAVAFLTLTNKTESDTELPHGNIAVISTALGTHLLGAVINLSVLFVFGDRLQKNGVLSKAQLIILARSFCSAAWWSPFFIATGVALTYAPDMSWHETLIPGTVMGAIALLYSILEVCFVRKVEFSGYPLRPESLAVPLFLAGAVISLHYFWPEISVLLIICLLAPAGALLFMRGRPRILTLSDFVTNQITSVKSQFTLFLAAGVFSTGIKSLTHVYPALFSLDGFSFTPLLFTLILGMLILVGTVGVHPLVSIAIVSPLLLPLSPDHSQLGFLFLSSWAISTGSSPLSGVGLALTGKYHASPKGILRDNYLYAIVMWLIASFMNVLFFARLDLV